MSTLTLAEMERFLDTLEYKPGWEFEVYETPHQGIVLAISARVEDSYSPGEYTDLRVKSFVPPFRRQSEFLAWLLWRLERIEIHECHEWLRYSGTHRPYFDPHAEDADEPR